MRNRKTLANEFLVRVKWQDGERIHLAGDASNRRYERIKKKNKRAVFMDAPPPLENVRAFVTIANLLRDLGLSTPKIFEADTTAGFLLIEDFGDTTYTERLSAGFDEVELYKLATNVLIHLHRTYQIDGTMPEYDNDLLVQETQLFVDWYMPAVLGIDTPDLDKAAFDGAWRTAFKTAREVPSSIVLRDFHADNLMLLYNKNGIAACGLLDFQDAVVGPVSYDLVSLLEDARRDVSAKISRQMLSQYLSAFPTLNPDKFASSYAILGAQRCTKILGIFTRLDRRDGKPQYLKHIARVWRWLESDLSHPALSPVKNWFDDYFPQKYRITPSPVTRA